LITEEKLTEFLTQWLDGKGQERQMIKPVFQLTDQGYAIVTFKGRYVGCYFSAFADQKPGIMINGIKYDITTQELVEALNDGNL